MKTPSNIKHTAALFSTVALLALPGHAAQNFSRTHSFSTGNSQFGMTASLFASDSFTVPTRTSPGSYSVTAGGNVKGRALGVTKTALDGRGTVKSAPNGTASLDASLKVLGISVLNVAATNFSSYSSPHFIKTWTVTAPFTVGLGPVSIGINGKVKGSVDAHIRAQGSFNPTPTGIPQVAFTVGPVADIAATATASLKASVPGVSVEVGAGGSMRIGKAALTATTTVNPTLTFVNNPNGIGVTAKRGANVGVTIAAQTSGINGRLFVFAEANILGAELRGEKTIATFTAGSNSTNLLGPVNFIWF